MDKVKEKILDLKASKVEACRICLATGVKMYSLQDTHLGTCMESIGSFTKSFEGLPDNVCYECAPILIKCHKLIEKSKIAQATLVDIFNKNGQINKPFIEEQKKSELKLQSSLDSYLLLNYFYVKHDDDSNTSDFIKVETDPNEKINISLKNEVKEESSEEVSDSEILKMIKDLSKEEEIHSDSDVEAIEVQVPVVEIISDDEKMGDDFISLKSYKVETDNPIKGLLAYVDKVPRYHTQKVRPLGLGKRGKKKEKKKRKWIDPMDIESARQEDKYVKRFFNINFMPPATAIRKKYSCKYCPATFDYVDAAKDHTFVGCQISQSSNGETNTAKSNQPHQSNYY